jgi:hypothetical protein
VPAARFGDAVAEHKPHVLRMSALLTTTLLGMQAMIQELQRRGLRDKVKVVFDRFPLCAYTLRWRQCFVNLECRAHGCASRKACGL